MGAHADSHRQRSLGPYEIISAIGAGGMGEVYRAKDTRLDRIVAIKVLPSHLADSPELKERFEREARTIASLNHPHIRALFDIGAPSFRIYPLSSGVMRPSEVLPRSWCEGSNQLEIAPPIMSGHEH